MKALLLAAGFGNRLKPITDYMPKCLVPINGKPLLAYWLENLVAAGVQDILINLHYKADQVQAFVDHSPYKAIVTTIYEEELLLTGGTLHRNRNFFGHDDVLMAHADNLCICDFKSFMRSYYNRPKHVDMTMMTFKTDNPQSCGVVELDNNNVVIDFYEKVKNPPTHVANGAVYILSQEVLGFLEGLGKEKIDFSTEVIPRFIGHINTFHNSVYHRDIGSIESYALAQLEMGRIKIPAAQGERAPAFLENPQAKCPSQQAAGKSSHYMHRRSFRFMYFNETNIGNLSEALYYALLKGRRLGKQVKFIRKQMFFEKTLNAFFRRHQLSGLYRLESPLLNSTHHLIDKSIGYVYGVLFWWNFLVCAVFAKLRILKHIRLKERGIGYQDLFNINRDDKFDIDSVKKINWAVLLEEKLELFLRSEDDVRCQSFLRQLGVSEGRWYVCLHIRSDFYHNDVAYEYRNSHIENYIEGIKYIRSLGGIVIRMGDAVPFGYEDYYIDYPNTPFRSEIMDLFLLKNCKFFWGTNSGIIDTAFLLGVPVLGVNITDFLFVRPYKSTDRMIYKHIFSREMQHLLSFEEVFKLPGDIIHTNMGMHIFEQFNKKYRLIENTSSEIYQAIVEMCENLDDLPEESLYQVEFKKQLNQCSQSWICGGYYHENIEGACRAAIKTCFNGRVGRDFSEKNLGYASIINEQRRIKYDA